MSGEWRKTNAKEAARADQCASVYPLPEPLRRFYPERAESHRISLPPFPVNRFP